MCEICDESISMKKMEKIKEINYLKLKNTV